MKRLEIFLLFLILMICLAARLYKIDRPIADWHSWRQADTAAVARNFIKEGFNPLIPRYDDMSSQANGLDNPQRYRFVEFPAYNALIALVWSQTGVNETYARVVTVIITLGSTVFLYLLVRHFSGILTASLAAFFFAAIPYNVFYSSTILPGPFMVFCLLGLHFSFTKWLDKEKQWLWYILAIIFANLAILSWPIAIFFTIPIVYLALDKYKLKALRNINLWIFTLASILPFLGWRLWMTQFPEGIPNWQFLVNEGNIRFKGAFFRWLIVERMGKLILTVGGFSLFILGILRKPQHEKLFYYSWLLSAAIYFVVFASGNVRHDYYQVPFIPIAAIFMAIGTRTLLNLPNQFNRLVGPAVALILIIFTLGFGFFEVRGFYWINRPQIISAGKAVDRILPKDATVIAPYNGDAAFLYQTNRHGYPIVDRPLEQFIDEGTKFLVSVDVNDPGIQSLARNCKLIESSSDYVLVEMYKECLGK